MKPRKPPVPADLLLRILLIDEVYDERSGDLEEVFRSITEEKGMLRGHVWYWFQVLKSIPTFAKNTLYWRTIMLQNYIKITLRNIRRHKVFSFINIAGLATGIACCLLLLLWVQDELGYDRFHANADSIYRLIEKVQRNEGEDHTFTHPAPHAPAAQSKASEIVDYVRIYSQNSLIQFEERGFYLRAAVIDPSLYEVFSFPLISGIPKTVLSSPKSVVLSEKTAELLFGNQDPLGRTVEIETVGEVSVTGVMRDIPANSHFTFDYAVPMSLFEQTGYAMDNWGDSRFLTYVQLSANASVSDVTQKIKYLDRVRWPDSTSEFFLQPLGRIHLYKPDGSAGAIAYVYIFSAVAALILIIACINFMNLATARSVQRSREIGLRKVVGAQRLQIIRQLLGESLLFTLMALTVAVLIVWTVLPAFNALAAKTLSFNPIANLNIFLGLLGITLLTGLLAGSYPAFFLSSFRPVKVLKSVNTPGNKSGAPLLRKAMVTLQFTLSIGLIIGTTIIYKQIHYMKYKDLGITKDNILCVKINDLAEDYNAIKSELAKNPNILKMTATFAPPAYASLGTRQLDAWEGKKPGERFDMDLLFGDFDYMDTFEMEVVAGRAFSPEFSTDAGQAFIVNEAAVKAMGFQDPVGKNMAWNHKSGPIIGVIKDFHLSSLHREIKPLGIMVLPWYNYLCFRLHPENIAGTMDFIKSTIQKFRPHQEITYKFMDEWIDARYRAEERMGTIIQYFTILAIFISCLGLLGLTSFTAEQRTKEIGIRKVLGSTVSRIVLLLSKDFLKWVIVSNLIAWPAAYLLMKNWLQNFAYRASLDVWIFVLSGSAALVIAMITVSYQSLRAALANPIDALKYE
ncbi:MAG: ABC transporter permease [Candidatus Aminicenantaceae bacterium]